MTSISLTPLRVYRVLADPSFGAGRAMACRPIGLCPPERLERGWSANRGARLTRVSAMRFRAIGGAANVQPNRTPVLFTMSPHGKGGRERCSTA